MNNLRRKSRKLVLFAIASKRMKYLEIKIKELKDMYTDNYKGC